MGCTYPRQHQFHPLAMHDISGSGVGRRQSPRHTCHGRYRHLLTDRIRLTGPAARGRFLIEWRAAGTRLREAAGDTPSDALEAQKRKRLELEADKQGLTILDDSEPEFPLTETIATFLGDIKTFRKKLTWQKYDHILNIFAEYVAPKSDARQITAEDVKQFLAWRKSKGFDPGTTLYTDRVILHNFFNRLKIDNPVKEVPKLPKFRKRPVAYSEAELKRCFGACTAWGEGVLFRRARDWTSPRRASNARITRPSIDASAIYGSSAICVLRRCGAC
jgi:Phage integrase, N-terminal SAM-like domain